MKLELARLGSVCFGCMTLAWALVSFPVFWRAADPERVAFDITAGRSFRTDLIGRDIAEMEALNASGLCRARARRAEAILRLYLYEDAFAKGRTDLFDAASLPLASSLRAALQCDPSDAYLWLLLFSVENTTRGFRPDNLEYLRMSYDFGAHEGWIALKRNPVALAMFSALDQSLARRALDEFAALVENGLFEESANIFAGTPPAIRDKLLERLSDIPIENRRRFSKAITEQLPSVVIPGVGREARQPWER